MGESSFKNIFMASVVIGLFAFLVIFFAYSQAQTYGKDTTSYDQNSINFTRLNNTLSNAQGEAEGWRETFENSNPLVFALQVTTAGIWGVGKTMFSFVIDLYNLIFIQIFNNVLHVPPIVSGVFIVLILVGAIFGLWRLLKIGD